MKKSDRDLIFNKYGGWCAYTGRPLEQDWQVDHMQSKINHEFYCYNNSSSIEEIKQKLKEVDHINNLLPALRIVNHYKRGHGLDGFREYMLSFHKRLQKLPKNTTVPKTKKRKEYMYMVASAFDITVDKPFSGQFYFETLEK